MGASDVKGWLELWDRLKGVLPGLWGRFRTRVIGPLQLVPHEPHCRWQEVRRNGRTETELRAVFHVTNTSKASVLLVAARLSEPATKGIVSVESPEDGVWGRCFLLPDAYAMASATFLIHPPIGAPGEDLVSDVVIVDNLNCHHRCRQVVFRHSP